MQIRSLMVFASGIVLGGGSGVSLPRMGRRLEIAGKVREKRNAAFRTLRYAAALQIAKTLLTNAPPLSRLQKVLAAFTEGSILCAEP